MSELLFLCAFVSSQLPGRRSSYFVEDSTWRNQMEKSNGDVSLSVGIVQVSTLLNWVQPSCLLHPSICVWGKKGPAVQARPVPKMTTAPGDILLGRASTLLFCTKLPIHKKSKPLHFVIYCAATNDQNQIFQSQTIWSECVLPKSAVCHWTQVMTSSCSSIFNHRQSSHDTETYVLQ